MSDNVRNTGTAMPIPLHKGGRLGRGLASLIGEPQPQAEAPLPAHGEQRLVPIAELQPERPQPAPATSPTPSWPSSPNSIRAKGLVQPIVVPPRPSARRLRDRRRRAPLARGAARVPAQRAGDRARPQPTWRPLEFALIENVQRADLNPMEEAAGYNELIEKHAYTQEQLSEVVGKSRSHVGNTLRLLKLPADVQALVREGKLSAGAARAIIGQKPRSMSWPSEIVARGLNVREVEALVNEMQQGAPARPGAAGRRPGRAAASASPPRASVAQGRRHPGVREGPLRCAGPQGGGPARPGETGYLTIQYGNYEQLDHIRNRLVGRLGVRPCGSDPMAQT